MYHCVKQHPPPHPSSLLEIDKKTLFLSMYPMWKPSSIFKISILIIDLTMGMGTILHNGTWIWALHFGVTLYFFKKFPMLIFVWFCTIQILLLNDNQSSSIWVVRLENYYNIKHNNYQKETTIFFYEGSLLEILSFATSHYATSMQLVVICNYLSDVCNYKFGIV
jgi:hypothetical protein